MSKFTPTVEFTEATRVIIKELISSGVLSAMSSVCQVSIGDAEDKEAQVTFSIARDPADILSGLYSKMISLDTEDVVALREGLKDIYRTIKNSIDDIEMQDALIATFAHALVACRQNDDKDTSNALLSLLDRSSINKKTKERIPGVLQEYKSEIIGRVVDISASGTAFNPQDILASSSPAMGEDEEDEEEDRPRIRNSPQEKGGDNHGEEEDDEEGDEQ